MNGVSTEHPLPGTRFVVGYSAVLATIPYLVLKAVWISGGTVGMRDPEFFAGPAYTFGNVLTAGMDVVAILLALTFTHEWGFRIPAWLVLVPIWVATGFLAPIVAIIPFAPIVFADSDPDSGPLRNWVYILVYGGFALQGILLSVAFVLYVRRRWSEVTANRDPGKSEVPGARIVGLALFASSLAALVGVFHLVWALGSTVGLPETVISNPPVAFRLTNAVYAVFAFFAVLGPPMLVHGRYLRVSRWLPFVLVWLGSGSLFAWGIWQDVTMAIEPESRTLLLLSITQTKILAVALIAGLALLLVRRPASR